MLPNHETEMFHYCSNCNPIPDLKFVQTRKLFVLLSHNCPKSPTLVLFGTGVACSPVKRCSRGVNVPIANDINYLTLKVSQWCSS